MLKRVLIDNYRSCLRTLIDLNPNLSVLIGPNGSGKTNILQAIMLLNKLALEERFGRRHISTGTVRSQIRAVLEDRNVSVQLRASIGTYTDQSNNDVLRGSKQRWRVTGRSGKTATLGIPLSFGSRGYDRLLSYGRQFVRRSDQFLEPWEARVLSNVALYCKNMKYYSASQFTNPGSCPASFEIEADERTTAPLRLRGHARLLYDMYSASKSDSEARYERFLDIVGPKGLRLISGLTFREVPTSSIDHSVRVGGKIEVRRRRKLLVVPQFKIGRQTLSPNQLSEGTFKTLALLFQVVTGDSTALLIEEPEVCVHHGLLASILELIKNYSREKQMIISTHSDYVLDHVAPDNVYRVTLERSLGTVVRHIPKSMTVRELAALRDYLASEGNLGDFWREGGFGD